ncbi:MAG: hypothetical protein RLZZ386_1592, partial [Planctomycetota bacterium]
DGKVIHLRFPIRFNCKRERNICLKRDTHKAVAETIWQSVGSCPADPLRGQLDERKSTPTFLRSLEERSQQILRLGRFKERLAPTMKVRLPSQRLLRIKNCQKRSGWKRSVHLVSINHLADAIAYMGVLRCFRLLHAMQLHFAAH